jgi:microcystin-dependent protein
MPRDPSGNYSLPPGYFAETGQRILPSQHNPPLEDIAQALTGSLPRNGSAPMEAPLKGATGDETVPGFSFNAYPGTGMFATANGVAFSVNGVKVLEFTDAGLIALPIGTPIPVMDGVLPDLCVWGDGRNISRTTYAALFAKWGTRFGAGDGSSTFGVFDTRGRSFTGRDNTGGTDANRLAGVPNVSGNRTTAGSVIGANLHTLVIGEITAHNHGGQTTGPSAALIYNQAQFQNISFSSANPLFDLLVATSNSATLVSNTTRTQGIASQGGGGAHNNVPQTLICDWAIFAGA